MQFQPILNVFNNPVELIVVSMIVGLLHVNIAYFLKLLNFVRAKSMFGVVGGIAYFGAQFSGIPYILKAVLRYSVAGFEHFPSYVLLYGAIICLATYVVCKTKIEGVFGLFLWIFDLAGLLGDVLSYTRLAGLGLAGVFLGSAFNVLCKMVFQGVHAMLPNAIGFGLGIILGTIVFSLGHLMNAALGVIGAFVHSLRLCSVEFLPKFFSGSGSEFTPIRFRINKKIVVRSLRT
jgi:V/A-type H+-transporting ATPase subunit I